VLSKQSCGLSTGREAKANVEHPFVVGHLQAVLVAGNGGQGEKNKRFILFVSFNIW
jgi:hypothetical protein